MKHEGFRRKKGCGFPWYYISLSLSIYIYLFWKPGGFFQLIRNEAKKLKF